jgi:hypothetical protein
MELRKLDKATVSRAFWAAMGTIYLGGHVLYFLGVRPRAGTFFSEVIPVNEPTALDWVNIGGILFLT